MKPKRRRRLIAGVVILSACGVLVLAITQKLAGNDKPYWTITRARHVVQACDAHREDHKNPDRGKYPRSLAELTKPRGDHAPLLRTEELLDDWDNPLRYAVVTNAKGDQEVYVWAERTVKGRLKLLGAKRKAGDEIELFGLED